MKTHHYFAVLLIVPLAAGCGGLSVAETTGVVRLKGQPLAKAVIVFSPKSVDAKTAVAITEEDGTFKLETTVNGNQTTVGVVPGDYTVTISKIVPPSGMSEQKYQSLIDAEEARQQKVGYSGETSVPPRVEMVPPDYSNAMKTKLAATIERKRNEFTFEIP